MVFNFPLPIIKNILGIYYQEKIIKKEISS